MPIPFHELDDANDDGTVAFLKIELGLGTDALPSDALGGLLTINARGEPMEFAFNRIELRYPALWSEPLARGHLQRRLVTSLLSASSADPRLLLCLADEVDAVVFDRDIRLEIPVARLVPAPAERVVDVVTGEVLAETSQPPAVAWHRSAPPGGSAALRAFERLNALGLLFEPFDRTTLGLREAFATSAPRGRGA